MVTPETEKENIKRARLIEALWDETGLIDDEDMRWLFYYARSYWHLARISDDSWARNRTEIFSLKMEIEDLERQLKENKK